MLTLTTSPLASTAKPREGLGGGGSGGGLSPHLLPWSSSCKVSRIVVRCLLSARESTHALGGHNQSQPRAPHWREPSLNESLFCSFRLIFFFSSCEVPLAERCCGGGDGSPTCSRSRRIAATRLPSCLAPPLKTPQLPSFFFPYCSSRCVAFVHS